MAEDGFLFGGSVADFVVTSDGSGGLLLGADTPVWFYNAGTGGTRYTTGLTDLSNAAITQVVSDATGAIPQLRGPTGVTAMWADASEGAGPRRLMVPVDLGDSITDLRATVTDLQSTQALLANSAGVLRYNTATSSWPARPADSRMYFWVGPTAPAEIPDGDLFVDTQP